MRRPLSIVLALLCMPLAACQTMTPEERRAADERTCAGYGFRPGTDAMAQCLLDLELDRRAEMRSWRDRQASTMWGPMYVERRIIIKDGD
ncbi:MULTISPECIES: hypothetical protein [Pseudorhizobium]|uniref:Lipoprotein n=1 Tax=Pseudorhizobium halotolerans TaxID=1233081 RepID=A0ABM8PZV9_9HYPH|nr:MULTISPECIES: hypothetical protein [Pseudorhizobium]CAD7056866.1 hypothetical protein RHAB21_01057 [Pseudorhizobium halotolerans]